MQLQVKARNLELGESIRTYAAEKLAKLERQLDDPRIELELAVEKNPSIAANHIAEATVWTRAGVIRARQASPDLRASIDELVDKLERQVTRAREKRRTRRRRVDGAAGVATVGEDDSVIVKTKQFAVAPLAPEEAVVQLELVGHDFFVFRNAESNEVNVLYRRRDGNYGLIETE